MTAKEKELAQELAETAALLARAAENLTKLASSLTEKPAPQPLAAAPGAAEYLDVKEAAELLEVSRGGLEGLRARGKGPPYIRIGRLIRYPRSRLHENSGKQLDWRQ